MITAPHPYCFVHQYQGNETRDDYDCQITNHITDHRTLFLLSRAAPDLPGACTARNSLPKKIRPHQSLVVLPPASPLRTSTSSVDCIEFARFELASRRSRIWCWRPAGRLPARPLGLPEVGDPSGSLPSAMLAAHLNARIGPCVTGAVHSRTPGQGGSDRCDDTDVFLGPVVSQIKCVWSVCIYFGGLFAEGILITETELF